MMLRLLTVLALATRSLARDTFIIGGSDVDIADFPWQGSYRAGSGSRDHICGCVFVGGEWVLTVAHCGGSSGYTMEFGGTDRGSGQVYGVTETIAHPDYGEGDGFSPNDIALIKASSEISGTNIAPATIAPHAVNPETDGWITGWGRTCFECESLPVTLQGTDIPIINDEECSSIHNDNFQADIMICVWGGVDGGIGSCNGDSGSPLTVGSTLYGLSSWGTAGCNTDFPDVYSRVGAYNDWICGETGNVASGC